ncbi:MAG: nuclear transport factor 2 family protein [Alphaproteobacteria bacterium]|nr:nuclear transport factor 2 family protein [Alphaproteobacteria bacterium]
MTGQADDHEDIRQLGARYNWAIDFGDIDAWVDCFTEDGVFTCVGLPDGDPRGGSHQGREALQAYGTAHYAHNKGRARHWNWNLLIEVDGDAATQRCYLNAYGAGQGETAILRVTGTYRDELWRTADGWRFASREVTVDPA